MRFTCGEGEGFGTWVHDGNQLLQCWLWRQKDRTGQHARRDQCGLTPPLLLLRAPALSRRWACHSSCPPAAGRPPSGSLSMRANVPH